MLLPNVAHEFQRYVVAILFTARYSGFASERALRSHRPPLSGTNRVNNILSPSAIETWNMNFETFCPCSTEALQMMSELQRIPAVVSAEIVLDLIYRTCQHEAMMQCKSCKQTPQPCIVIFQALSEQCLPLLEALCSTYNIATQPGFFDQAILAMGQSTSRYICIRNMASLGQTELEEEETKLLVGTIIGQRLRRLLVLMESLMVMLENSNPHQNGIATPRTIKSPAERIMNKLKALMQTIDGRDAIPSP